MDVVNQEDPQTTHARLNRGPDRRNKCDSCESEPAKVLRCSQCKNAFYCDQQCQKKAWFQHRLNCSPLPLGALAYPARWKPEEYQDLENEVRRVSLILQGWIDAYEPHKNRVDWHPLWTNFDANKILRDAQVSLRHCFCCHAHCSVTDPTLKAMIPVIQLMLIHLLDSRLPQTYQNIDESEGRSLYSKLLEDYLEMLQKGLDETQSQCNMARLWSPKVVCMPGRLSAGEYVALADCLVSVKRCVEGFCGASGKEEDAYEARLDNLQVICGRLFGPSS